VADAGRDEWVKRVLGIEIGAAPRSESAARGEEARRSNPRSIESTKMLLRWREAQRTLSDNLTKLANSILVLPDVQNDPRFADVKAAVGELPNLVPTFGGELEDLLDAGINAGASKSPALIADTLAAVSRYRSMLAEVPQLSQLETFGAKVGVSVQLASALDTVMQDMEADLRRAA
jgi:hypothetical protein